MFSTKRTLKGLDGSLFQEAENQWNFPAEYKLFQNIHMKGVIKTRSEVFETRTFNKSNCI